MSKKNTRKIASEVNINDKALYFQFKKFYVLNGLGVARMQIGRLKANMRGFYKMENWRIGINLSLNFIQSKVRNVTSNWSFVLW